MTDVFDQHIDGVDQVLDQTESNRLALKNLLDIALSAANKHMAVRGAMGTSMNQSGTPRVIPTYSVMHSLQWIGSGHIRMGSEMDFMRSRINEETGKLEIDSASAEEVRQRAPDWSRYSAM